MQLYDQDAFCRTFTSKVLRCEENKDSFFEIELENTAFYPEGGGQPWDLGLLSEEPVLEVRKRGDAILHIVKNPLPLGENVTGVIDWTRRFDFMQQHSGEHIVSGLAHSLYGCDNVGFHMGKDFVTIDFNKELSPEQLKELESKANDYIWENHPIKITYPTEVELKTLDYRSKKELSGEVRVVSFPDADCCACCGTHVNTSGQVGFVVLLSWEKFREGVRIELLCGNRALTYLSKIKDENSKISQLLSAKVLETSSSVARMQKEKEVLSQEKTSLEKKYIKLLAEKYVNQENVTVFLEDFDSSSLTMTATEISKNISGTAFCFTSGGDGTFRYAFASKEGDVRVFSNKMKEIFQGRGGGKEHLVQGSLSATKEDLSAYFSSIN